MYWQHLLHEIRAKKQKLARLDARVGLPVMAPDGAPPGEIAAAEWALGGPLSPSYRELLAVHDGVPELYQGASLLSARHLARGAFVEIAQRVIARGDPASIEDAERGRSALVPFGVDRAMETIFAWDLSAPRRGGEPRVVVWINEIGEQIESFPSFLEFILAMIEADVEERLRALRPSRRRLGAPASALAPIDVAPAQKLGERAVFAA